MVQEGNMDSNRVMPDLAGMELDRALRLLELAGAEHPLIRLVPNRGKKGAIVAQSPEPGTTLHPGTLVRLDVEEDNPIRLLPEVFQEEDKLETGAGGAERVPNMLHNFLYIPQTLLTELGRKVQNMHRMLSPEGAPASFLPWLARLIPMEFDAGWPEDVTRAVIRDAPRLLSRRGTAEGLEEMIELHTGVQVKVHENAWPHMGNCVGQSMVGQAAIVSTVPRSEDAFYVELPAGEKVGRAVVERILRIIDAEKPVHLRCCVVQSRESAPSPVEGDRVGWDFVVGVSRVSGPVTTPPARWGARCPVPTRSKHGDGSVDSSVEVPEEKNGE